MWLFRMLPSRTRYWSTALATRSNIKVLDSLSQCAARSVRTASATNTVTTSSSSNSIQRCTATATAMVAAADDADMLVAVSHATVAIDMAANLASTSPTNKQLQLQLCTQTFDLQPQPVPGTATLDSHNTTSSSTALKQQPLPASQAGAASSAEGRAYTTQLLAIDAAVLPPASAPDAAVAQQLLSAEAAPDLNRSSCPHLYYTLPDHLRQPNSSSSSCGAGSVRIVASSSESSVSGVEQQPQQALQQAALLLQRNLPVAIPTETVYGLAGNALSAAAVASIFKAKGRPSDNPLIVHVSDLDMLAQLYPNHTASAQNPAGFIPQQYHRLVAAFWPGPLTILLPASPLIPASVTAGQPTMAVRMPAHPVARALIAAAGVPLAAPSANTSGRPSPTTAQHVLEDLAGLVPAVVDGGPCGFGVESTVLDGLRVPPVVLRPGGVTAELLLASPDMAGLQVYSRDFTDKALEANPTTPGMKYRHYSPSAPVLLLDPAPAWQQQQQQQAGAAGVEQPVQEGEQQLQQLMAAATHKLLQQLQQQQPHLEQQQQLNQVAAGACRRVILLSTCSCSSSSELAVGWTPDSLARIQANKKQPAAAAAVAAADADSTPGQAAVSPQQHPTAGLLSELHSRAGASSSVEQCCSATCEVLEYVLGSWQQPEVVAQQLFSGLRAADAVGGDVVVVQGVLPVGPGLAVMNRLHKAASQRLPVVMLLQ